MAQGDHTALGRVLGAQAVAHPGQSGFQVMAAAHAAFALRAALAEAAERTLDLQYYSVGDDATSNLLLQRILAAAERGVRVRILLDDVYAATRAFAQRAAAAHPRIEVRLFNPFFFGGSFGVARVVEFALDEQRLNRRMHNKLWITDNAAAIVGSRNLGDEYFGAFEGANFNDVDLLAAGPVVNDLSTAFDTYWNSAAAIPLQALMEPLDANARSAVREALHERARQCGSAPPCAWIASGGLLDALRSGSVDLSWARARAVYDQPDLPKSGPATGIEHPMDADALVSTRSELLIVSPYFIPGEDGRRHLGDMLGRGARVAVLTNSLSSTDVTAAHAAYARHRADLLRGGLELYETRVEPGTPHRSHRWGQVSPSSLHAKIVVQDRVRALVGSVNQDPRSRLRNTEAWIELESAELARDLASLFADASDLHHAFKVELDPTTQQLAWRTEERGQVVRYDSEPATGFWLRLWRSTLGVLIPEHQL